MVIAFIIKLVMAIGIKLQLASLIEIKTKLMSFRNHPVRSPLDHNGARTFPNSISKVSK